MTTRCRSAALAAAILIGVLGGSRPAGAITVELPGERNLEIHGWYEMRLRFVGDDMPGDDITFSQFEHVLNVETELPLFPDGIGPFDFMLAYARFQSGYECIYSHGCGVSDSIDEYGGVDGSTPRHLPANVRPGLSGEQFVGATGLKRRLETRNLTPVYEDLNPGERPRGPINPSGISANPNPSAALANLNARSRLDAPIDQFAPGIIKTRAASFTSDVNYGNYLVNARALLGDENFLDLFGRFSNRQFLRDSAQGRLRVLNRQIQLANQGGADPAVLQGLITQRDALLFTDPADPNTVQLDFFFQDPVLQKTFLYPELPDGQARNLLVTRPDLNIFANMANVMAPELLTTTFGSHHLEQRGAIPYRSTIGSPVKPLGFLTGQTSVDIINNSDIGVATSLKQLDTGTLPGANLEESSQNNVVPLFVGPDGLYNTADDLPPTRDLLSPDLILEPNIPPSFTTYSGQATKGVPDFNAITYVRDSPIDIRTGRPQVLFGIGNEDAIVINGCTALFGTLQDGECRSAKGELFPVQQVREAGCAELAQGGNSAAGFNGQDECVVLNNQAGLGVPGSQGVNFNVIPYLNDPRFRPETAFVEPPDLTDFKGLALLRNVPVARPRAPGNSVVFRTAGTQRLLKSTHHLISNLDLDFDVSELEWGHGASDDEHEFREGYVEFEMANSQVFARVGKQLIVWGKTEIFRGQDRFNPQDLSDGFGSSLQDSRIGQWGADVVLSPSWAMKLGPLRDLRFEAAMLYDDFEPSDLGVCGEAGSPVGVCAKLAGAYAHGLSGIGLVGEDRPDETQSGWSKYDYGARIEGHWDRFAFSVTDFWGWDDTPITEVVFDYTRRTDPDTGALVNPYGRKECKVRTAEGAGGQVAAGPDGDPATAYDNQIPSIGNCLLFDDPTGPGPQPLRAREDIAANHAVNQTLFHTVCTMTFDPDRGYCAFDQANDPESFTALAQLLSGIASGVQTIAAEGVDTIRFEQQGPTAVAFTQPGESNQASAAAAQLFRPIPGADITSSLPLSADEGAMLGCGPAFVSPCGANDEKNFAENPDFRALVGLPPSQRPAGGIDFMNADASVLTQEFTILKGLQPGAAVGLRNNSDGSARFEPGITLGGVSEAQAATRGVVVSELLPLSNEERVEYLKERIPTTPGTTFASDAWIEPFPWKVDQQVLDKDGLLLFKVAPQSERDPRCDPGLHVSRDATGEPVGPPEFSAEETRYCSFRSAGNQVPDGPTPWELDPNRIILNDPTDPTNPANDFLVEFEGTLDDVINRTQLFLEWREKLIATTENCTPFLRVSSVGPAGLIADTYFDEGCTKLETVSANFERFFTALELIGGDRIFDPPETLSELLSMTDSSYINDQFGDPISGPDGLVSRNLRIFADPTSSPDARHVTTQNDVHALRFEQAGGVVVPTTELLPSLDLDGDSKPDGRSDVPLSEITMSEFFAAVNPETLCPLAGNRSSRCHAQLGVTGDIVGRGGQLPSSTQEATALPLGIRSNFSQLDGAPVPEQFRQPLINMWELAEKRPLEFAGFWGGDQVEVSNLDPNGVPLALDDPNRIRLKYDRDQTGGAFVLDFDTIRVRAVPDVLNRFKSQQGFDPDGIATSGQPLDQDQDGVYDGSDDGTAGPVSDDNILCGSGFPGDVLQEGGQFEFFSEAEESAFAQRFPKGIPRRSPINCGTASAVLGGTGITLPFRRAGGDGTYGRRDFQWHGGREVVLSYEKRNVLGAGLDFAHDPSRTSWNLELSWENDLHIPDTNEVDGLSNSDQYVFAVSVDRPTFFRFLNPSRTFFLNFQVFLRYLSDYNGDSDDHDGNFAYADGPLTSQLSFTFFTGYFQDRLTPRTTFVWDPSSTSYGLLWGVGYRFRNNLTADVRMNHFFGHTQTVRRAFYPNSLYTDPRTLGGTGRGFANAYNEDSAGLAIRYSW